jgi:hypothetical protein
VQFGNYQTEFRATSPALRPRHTNSKSQFIRQLVATAGHPALANKRIVCQDVMLVASGNAAAEERPLLNG